MKLEQIEMRVKDIEDVSGDPEVAHGLEDRLREDFIKYVASLSDHLPQLAEKARLVLTTSDIDFPRWTA